MSEQGREPLIRLPVDQEVFVESIHNGDVVDDATVATEVVSFERDGDAYQLEGAIVFAGYVRKRQEGKEMESFSIGTEDGEDDVIHVHHRMPFSLRVPVSAQPSGLVNVKSRLSGFALHVSSDNWLNVQGSLEVHGLMGNEGFHFRCGAQEAGQGFAENVVRTAADDQAFAMAGADTDLWRHEDEDAKDDVDEQNADVPMRSAENETLEQMSQARGGHGWSEQAELDAAPAPEGPVSEQAHEGPLSQSDSMRGELANLDRFFVPQSPHPAPSAEPVAPTNTAPIASFEFEHQLDEDVLPTQNPEFSISGTFSGEYRGVDHWIPKFTISGAVETGEEEESEADVVVDESMERHEMAVSQVTQNGLWSFVDFNGPEPRHTMRYVIVMEEETLEAVADRCNCMTSELQRANPWLDGQTVSGQALYIPAGPFQIPRVPIS